METNVDLRPHNTLGLPAVAARLIRVQNLSILPFLQEHARLPQADIRILGAGSNVVLPPYITDLVLKIENQGRRWLGSDAHYHYVSAAAGESWHDFVLWTLEKGWGGLENLVRIPGTVGAAPVQNIGAYGVEVKDLIDRVWVYDRLTRKLETLGKAACGFEYRDSLFRQTASRYVITEVIFRLPTRSRLRTEYGDIRAILRSQQWPQTPQGVAKAIMHLRAAKLPDPAHLGNAGSFFKNPVVSLIEQERLLRQYSQLPCQRLSAGRYKLSAAWLIERAGWKGKALGPVQMYEQQALVLINQGGAKRDDVLRLAHAVQADVYADFQIHLEPEAVYW